MSFRAKGEPISIGAAICLAVLDLSKKPSNPMEWPRSFVTEAKSKNAYSRERSNIVLLNEGMHTGTIQY